jgi:hypothetical protein
MKKIVIFGLIIFLIAGITVLTIRFFSGEDNWVCENGEWVKHGNPKTEKPSIGCGIEVFKKEEEASQKVKEPSIVVFNPKENAAINSPFDVEGKAIAFENMIGIRLKDANGKILFQDSVYVNSPDVGQYGLFQKEITFETSQEEGSLEVFESSMQDGSDINKIAIPVKFSSDEKK